MKKSLFLALMLSAAFAHAAPADDDNAAPANNAQYGQTMSQISADLQEGRAEAAFAKVQPLAEQGYPEAQYILGTMKVSRPAPSKPPSGTAKPPRKPATKPCRAWRKKRWTI